MEEHTPATPPARAPPFGEKRSKPHHEPAPTAPHARFSHYYGVFLDYAVAIVGARALPSSSSFWACAQEAGSELHRCGGFGKGSLSRGRPSFGQHQASRQQNQHHEGERHPPPTTRPKNSSRAKRERSGYHRRCAC